MQMRGAMLTTISVFGERRISRVNERGVALPISGRIAISRGSCLWAAVLLCRLSLSALIGSRVLHVAR